MKQVIVFAIVIIIGICLLSIIGVLPGGEKFGFTLLPKIEEKSEISAHTTIKEVLPIAEYAALAYHYTSVVKDVNARDIKGWTIPFTTRRYIFTFDGKIRLGIDGNQIRVEEVLQDEAAALPIIRIYLPPIKILSHEVMDDSIEVFEQTQTIFNGLKIADAFNVTADRKREMEEKVMASSLVKEAEASAELHLGALIGSLPVIKGKYELEFVWQNTEN
jgi:hypothetical protein